MDFREFRFGKITVNRLFISYFFKNEFLNVFTVDRKLRKRNWVNYIVKENEKNRLFHELLVQTNKCCIIMGVKLW